MMFRYSISRHILTNITSRLKRQCDVTYHDYKHYNQVIEAFCTFIFNLLYLLMMAYTNKPNLVAEVFK